MYNLEGVYRHDQKNTYKGVQQDANHENENERPLHSVAQYLQTTTAFVSAKLSPSVNTHSTEHLRETLG